MMKTHTWVVALAMVGCSTVEGTEPPQPQAWSPPDESWQAPRSSGSRITISQAERSWVRATRLVGVFYASPVADPTTTATRLGYCHLRGPNDCSSGACEYVRPISAGAVTFGGLPTTMFGAEDGEIQTQLDNALMYTSLHEGPDVIAARTLRLSATGGVIPAFDVTVPIAPSFDEITHADVPALSIDEDFVVTWAQPDPAGFVRLTLPDCQTRDALVCEAPDTGSLVVTRDILAEFVASATWTTGTPYPCAGSSATFERIRIQPHVLPGGHSLDVITEHGVVLDALTPTP